MVSVDDLVPFAKSDGRLIPQILLEQGGVYNPSPLDPLNDVGSTGQTILMEKNARSVMYLLIKSMSVLQLRTPITGNGILNVSEILQLIEIRWIL